MYKRILFCAFSLVFILTQFVVAEKYAVLITGDYADNRGDNTGHWAQANYSTRSPMEEFWNDTYLMWDMLVNDKGFDNENVYILFADGEDHNPLGDEYDPPYKITDYSATKSNVLSLFNGLANGTNGFPLLTEDDFLFVWTFDHGNLGWTELIDVTYEPGGGQIISATVPEPVTPPYSSIRLLDYNGQHIFNVNYITNWDDDWPSICGGIDWIDGDHSITVDELDNLLESIETYKTVVLMQQCFGGGFKEFLTNNHTIFLSASEIDQYAWRADTLYQYSGNNYAAPCEWDTHDNYRYKHGEFNYHLINSFVGKTPEDNPYYETDYVDFLIAEADNNSDGFITIEEAKEWEEGKESNPEIPQWSDQDLIGGSTSLEYPTVLSENITSSLTIRGEIAVTKTISVSSGATLTIKPGASIKVKPGKSIIVYGSLNAVGTSSKPIVFNKMEGSSWGGIDLINSQSSTLEYCEVKNALGGSQGIYIYNCEPYIKQCYLHDNTYGCYSNYYADPVFYYNTFSNNSWGIKCYNSDAHFGEPHDWPIEPPRPGYNDIINNTKGLFATNNSYVFLGMHTAMPLGGYNSLDFNSSIDIVATVYSTVSADHNWWGTDLSPNCSKDGSSNIYVYYPLRQDPNGGSSLAKSGAGEDMFNPDDIDKNNPDDLLRLAKYYHNIGLYNEALDTSEKIIYNFPETNYAILAMKQIYSISKSSDIVDIEKYCLDNINTKENSDQIKIASNEILVSKYMLEKKNDLAEVRCNYILTHYPDIESEKYALFNLFLMVIHDAGKADEAQGYKAELEAKYPDDMLTFEARSLSGEDADWSLAKESVEESEELADKSVLHEEFNLYPAYPNPFNPSTTISFDLPQASKVNLEIYNVQGLKVWSYNDKEFSAGNHSVVWKSETTSGSILPSGMYFIHFQSGPYYSSQKLLLIK